MHCLPLNQLTKSNVIQMPKIFKGLLDVDFAMEPDVSIGYCMHLRVEINVLQPLFDGFTNKKQDGSHGRVRFRYERLPEFCHMCGVLDHQIRKCRNLKQALSP